MMPCEYEMVRTAGHDLESSCVSRAFFGTGVPRTERMDNDKPQRQIDLPSALSNLFTLLQHYPIVMLDMLLAMGLAH